MLCPTAGDLHAHCGKFTYGRYGTRALAMRRRGVGALGLSSITTSLLSVLPALAQFLQRPISNAAVCVEGSYLRLQAKTPAFLAVAAPAISAASNKAAQLAPIEAIPCPAMS